MGGNESREVDESGNVDEGEDGIYRDLLEVDGCDSVWYENERTVDEMSESHGGEESITTAHASPRPLEKDVILVPEERDSPITKDVDGRQKRAKSLDDDASSSESVHSWDGFRRRSGSGTALTTHGGELVLSEEGRPLAEPPVINYQAFVKDKLPSPGKLKLMFANDVVAKTEFLDSKTEEALLREYYGIITPKRRGPTVHPSQTIEVKRFCFYNKLADEIAIDAREAERYHESFKDTLGFLISWEDSYLDNDDENGNTTYLRELLEQGQDPFSGYDDMETCQIQDKYGYLVDELPRRPVHDMETWLFYQRAKGATNMDYPLPRDHYALRKVIARLFTNRSFGGDKAWEEFRSFTYRGGAEEVPCPIPETPYGGFPIIGEKDNLYKQLSRFFDEYVFLSDPSHTSDERDRFDICIQQRWVMDAPWSLQINSDAVSSPSRSPSRQNRWHAVESIYPIPP